MAISQLSQTPRSVRFGGPANMVVGESDSRLLIEHALLGASALGLVAILAFPEARGASETYGWLPFWLLALPICAWAVARALRGRASQESATRPLARVHRLDAGVPHAARSRATQGRDGWTPRRAA